MPNPFFLFTDRELTATRTVVDFAGNTFRACSYLITHSNDSGVLVRRYLPNGTLQQEWDLLPDPPRKVTNFDMIQAGADLLIAVSYHDAVSTEGRASGVYPADVPGVAVAYPHGTAPQGAPTDLVGWRGVSSPPPDPGYTLDQIAHAVLTAIKADMAGELGGLVQGRAKNGARQGIQTEAGVGGALGSLITTENMGQVYADSDAIYQQLGNVDGAQAIKILVEFGVIAPDAVPTTGPHSWPRQLAGWPWGR